MFDEQLKRRGRGAFASLAGVLVLFGTLAAGPLESPVADAAESGDLEAVRALLRSGADVNAAQSDGMTALHWAAQRGDAEVASVLLFAGATVRPTTRLGGYTPLHLASRAGHAAVVEQLLAGGADPDHRTATGVTAMHFAAEADAAEVIRLLASAGADVNAADAFSERTPLMFAAVRNATRAVDALVAAGAVPDLETSVRDFAVIDQANRDEQARRRRVMEAAVDPEPEVEDDAQSPVQSPGSAQAEQRQAATPASRAQEPRSPDPASREPHEPDEPEEPEEPEEPTEPVPEVKALSSAEQIGPQGGFTALHYAAREGHLETAERLLAAGADVNQVTGGDQSSPLLVAVINGNYDLARMFIESGADPNLVSDDGAGPLFAALNIEWSLRTWYPQPQAFRQQNTDYLELMQLLLDAGADPNQRTSTHIWYAAYNAGRMGVDFTGATPFWRAAYAADVSAMKLLVEHGADPNIWTIKLPSRRRFSQGNAPPPDPDEEPEVDPSGLPEIPVGGPAVHPLHAASGVGFGTSRVAQQHRHVPDGWLPAVQYLVGELGMDPNLRDMDGYTALHHSAARGDNATILYLVSQGADIGVISRRGQTTADLANSPEQRAQPLPSTVVLLEKLGSLNNHQCRSCGGN